MSAAVHLDHIGYALGSQKVAVEDTVAAGRTRAGAPELLGAGFRYHHVCADSESSWDLARAAVECVGSDLGAVDAIIYATCIPANANVGDPERFRATGDVKHLMDFPASRLQAHFGLERAMVIGVAQQACTSMLGSLRLARALLTAEPTIERVLCVSADRFPPGALYEQAYNLVSDGAAACVVTRAPAAYRIVAVHQVTNGAMVQADDDQTVGAYFSYTHRVVSELLAGAGLTAGDVDWVVPQNTDPRAWAILARLLGVDAGRVASPSLADAGHVISADNLVNLALLDRSGEVRGGDKLLLVMAGYGMNWQAALLEKT